MFNSDIAENGGESETVETWQRFVQALIVALSAMSV